MKSANQNPTPKSLQTIDAQKIDPLYVIFEQHLMNFQDEEIDRPTFIANIVQEYFVFLRKKAILIPKSLEQAIFEELATQVNTMLIKKIYGCLTLTDYRGTVSKPARRKAQDRYKKLKKVNP